MRFKPYHLILLALLLTISSCSKDGSKNSNVSNTLTVKTNQGVSVNTKYSSATTQIANTFQVTFQPGTTNQGIRITIYVDQSNFGVISVNAPSLGVGTYDTNTYTGVNFTYQTTNWLPPTSYFMSVTFTNYNPHGRITGSALRKEINGNIIETATFDFMAN